MVHMGERYDPNEHDAEQRALDPLPAGWWAMQFTESDVKPTKSDPESAYLELVAEPLEQNHPSEKGRKVWIRLNKWNKNSEAVRIANNQLAAICKAIGIIEGFADSEALHHKPLAIKLKVVTEKGYEPKNEVVAFEPLASRFGQGAAASGVPRAQATRPTSVTPPPPGKPWGK